MSHPSVLAFFSEVLRELKPRIPAAPRVLEIGSYDVNGSIRGTLQKQISPGEHIGVDMTPGPGVDLVCSGHTLDLPTASFDLTISAECLEHNPHYADTLRNMRRLTRQGGCTIISCATTGRFEHGTTRTNPGSSPGTQAQGWDYYKNLTRKDFPQDFLFSFEDHMFWHNPYSCDLYFVGSVSGRLPEALHAPLACTRIKPVYSLFNRVTLALPLYAIRKLVDEQRYQDLGVAYVRARARVKRLLAS